ncbi:hypothetical protein BH11PLA1_BH11PLA1_00840 [soil metagenome]
MSDAGNQRGWRRRLSLGRWAGAGALASARSPWRAVMIGFIVLGLSLAALSRVQFAASLGAMLGESSRAGAAFERVTTEYQADGSLYLLVEGKGAGHDGSEADLGALMRFAELLEKELQNDAAARVLVASVRHAQDPEMARFAREVMLPAGMAYLDDAGRAELARRLTPEALRAQFARNEAMVATPGPAGAALAAGVLRDPLRLFELIPPELAAAAGNGASGPDADRGRAENPAPALDLSRDGRALLIHISSTAPADDLAAAARLVDVVTASAARANVESLRVAAAGPAAIASSASRSIREDSTRAAVLSSALVFVLFFIFYRRWSAGIVIGAVAGTGMLAGVAVYTLFAPALAPLSAIIAALLAGLGIDYGTHFTAHYDAQRARGRSSVRASLLTAREMAAPIITNCFTSIFGFASLWPSPIRMLREFASLGAVGLLGALLAVFLLLPAALRLIDRNRPALAERPSRLDIAPVIARAPRMLMGSTLAVLALVVIAAGVQGFVPQIEGDLRVLHPQPSPALEATDEVLARFTTVSDAIPIEVRSADAAGLLPAAHAAARALRSEELMTLGVVGVLGLPTLVPQAEGGAVSIDAGAALAAFDSALGESAFEPTRYAGYRRVLETLLRGRPAPTIATLMQYPGLAARLFPRVAIESGAAPHATVLLARLAHPLREREERTRVIGALRSALAPVPQATVAGLAAVSDELEDATRAGLPQSIALSAGLVVLWLLVMFRRPVDVLLALVPLTFAGVLTYCFMVALGLRFNPINSVAIPLLDGIAVDAGVFLVAAARTHRAEGRAGLLRHLSPTVRAVLLAVLTTVTAFASLCITRTPAIRSLGLVAAVGATASLVGAVCLLLPMLLIREKKSLAVRADALPGAEGKTLE